MAPEKRNFRVIISGGSVAGLTLALALRRKNIDFVVLEAREEIAPQEGASISINGSAGPALDQLGVLDDILKETEVLTRHITWDEHGKHWATLTTPEEMARRHNYPLVFLERQVLLQNLYDHLREGKESVLTKKKVTKVETFDTHVHVHCADGSSYEGDLIIGADGVRSVVREHMWNYMEHHDLKEEAEEGRKHLTCTYECTFGISTATPGLRAGDINRTLGEGWTFLNIIGKDAITYWFLIKKLDREYRGSEIPRLNKGNVDEHVAPFLHLPVTDSITFGDMYKNVVVANRVALEEGLMEKWSIDRIVLIGDAIHKISPNSGQGGMMAVEDAVSLTNSICKLLENSTEPKVEDIDSCLEDWQGRRRERVTTIFGASKMMVRNEALDSFKAKIMMRLHQYMAPLLLKKIGAYYRGAELLDIPYPVRATTAPIPYERVPRFWKDPESTRERAKWSIPFVGLLVGACIAMGTLIPVFGPGVHKIFDEGVYATASGEVIDALSPVYNIPILNEIFIPLITAFLPSITNTDSSAWAQMLSFITDCGAVYAIWLLESYRKGSSLSNMIFTIIMGTAFQFGAGFLTQIFYLTEYIKNPSPRLLKGNYRDIEIGTSISLLAALAAAHYLPVFATFLVPSMQDRRWWNAIWQIFPITVPLLQAPLALLLNAGAEKKNSSRRRKHNKKSLLGIKITYRSIAAISALSYLYAYFTRPAGATLGTIFWPGVTGFLDSGMSFTEALGRFLQYDHIFSMASGFVWLGLRFREIERAGASFSWFKTIIGLAGMMVAFGPGAAFAVGWGWKEELLQKLPEHKW